MVMHVYVPVPYVDIVSDNGLMPDWHQAITWEHADLLVSWNPRSKFWYNFNENKNIFIQEIAFENQLLALTL